MSVSVVHAQPTVTWTRALAGAGPGLMAMLIMMLMASVLIAERAVPSTDDTYISKVYCWRWVVLALGLRVSMCQFLKVTCGSLTTI